jgi:uncharacterized protein (UPF0332 family)
LSQESFDNQRLIAYRFERAKETLQDAHLLFDQEGSPGSIINRYRSYYAMFYGVLALLTTIGKGSSKHSGVISLFDQYFVKGGKFPKSMSKLSTRRLIYARLGITVSFLNWIRSRPRKFCTQRIDLLKQLKRTYPSVSPWCKTAPCAVAWFRICFGRP